MFTKNIKNSFTTDLLNAVSGVLNEAKKKCSPDCECETCVPDEDETNEGYMPTNDMPSAKDRKTAGKLAATLKSERLGKEKREPNGVKTEDTDMPWSEDPNNPTRKVSSRKDEYGNKVKNVAKHLARKAMKANEEVEQIDEISAGLAARAGDAADNRLRAIRNKRKLGTGPSHAETKLSNQVRKFDNYSDKKQGYTEEVEELDEISAKTAVNAYAKRNAKAFNDGQYDDEAEKDYNKLDKQMGRIRRKFGQKTLMKASGAAHKAIFGEEVELEEGLMHDRYLRSHGKKARGTGSWAFTTKQYGSPKDNQMHFTSGEKSLSDAHKEAAAKLGTKHLYVMEEVEALDELSVKTLDSYRTKARRDIIDADDNDDNPTYNKRTKGYLDASRKVQKKLAKEEAEQIDELSNPTLGSYVKKASNQALNKAFAAGANLSRGPEHEKTGEQQINKAAKRVMGVNKAINKMTKEEQEFIDALNNDMFEEVDGLDESYSELQRLKGNIERNQKKLNSIPGIHPEKKRLAVQIEKDTKKHKEIFNKYWGKNEEVDQIDEISREALGSYVVNAASNLHKVGANRAMFTSQPAAGKLARKAQNRQKGIETAVSRMTKEDAEITEARGRPRKAGARDFTIHPKTKEKLMHNNPEHMARIERLQKTGALQKPKTEANQHIIQQLQRAKLSMRGGETVNFTHGDAQHVTGQHAAKLLDRYAGMKPDDKEAFQKKIGHSHANLKSEL